MLASSGLGRSHREYSTSLKASLFFVTAIIFCVFAVLLSVLTIA
jgi:hypothetical protein